jgi:hypothetical protein
LDPADPLHIVIYDFGTWTGSGERTCYIDADHEKFMYLVYAGNLSPVSSQFYYILPGSTYIIFKEAYLNTLPNGVYYFIAEFTDYDSSRIKLVIDRPENASGGSYNGSPKTGDDPYILFLTTALAIVSLNCLLLLILDNILVRRRLRNAD